MARHRRRRNRRVVVMNARGRGGRFVRRRRRARAHRNYRRRYRRNYRRHYYRRNEPARPRRRRRRHYYRNRHRHYRRNVSRGSRVQLTRPMTWFPYVLTGGVAATVSAFAPRAFGLRVTAMQAYGIQAAVAVLGAGVVGWGGRMIGLRGQWHAMAWVVGAGAPIVADLVGRRALKWLGLGELGMDVYPYQALSQEPYYPPRLYAYAYQPGGYDSMFRYPTQEHIGAPEAPFEHMYNT